MFTENNNYYSRKCVYKLKIKQFWKILTLNLNYYLLKTRLGFSLIDPYLCKINRVQSYKYFLYRALNNYKLQSKINIFISTKQNNEELFILCFLKFKNQTGYYLWKTKG